MKKRAIAIRFRNFYNDEMSGFRAKLLILFFAVCLFAGCAADETANSNQSARNQPTKSAPVVPLDDVEALGKIVKLPAEPIEATYCEFDLSRETNARPSVPNAKRLVAALLFSADNADQIANAAGTAAPLDVDAENWFPPELIAKSQETGDETLKGTSVSAKDFLQPPYVNGRLTRINDTNYFVLELLTF